MATTPKKLLGDYIVWFSEPHNSLRMARASEPEQEFELDVCCFNRSEQSTLLDIHSANFDVTRKPVHTN